MNNKKQQAQEINLPETKTSELKGKQSVRATFKLSQDAIDAISIVAVHLGIKRKSLFEHLIEDADSLEIIANEIGSHALNFKYRIQKTYVLSRNTLSSLEQTSQQFDTSRDELVEYSIRRLMPLIAEEQEKHKKRKEIVEELENHIKNFDKLLKKSKQILGTDDPIYDKLKKMIISCKAFNNDMKEFIEKGKIIEDFQCD